MLPPTSSRQSGPGKPFLVAGRRDSGAPHLRDEVSGQDFGGFLDGADEIGGSLPPCRSSVIVRKLVNMGFWTIPGGHGRATARVVPMLEGMVTANPAFPELSTRHSSNLSKFVLRARRVEAHSLNRDKDALAALAHMGITLHRHPNGTDELVHVLPPEELVESAAARIRPVLLDGDPVHWGKTLAALGYFVQDDADLTAMVKVLRGDWRKLMPRDGSVRGYSLILAGSGLSEVSQTLPDSIMAVSWFFPSLDQIFRRSL